MCDFNLVFSITDAASGFDIFRNFVNFCFILQVSLLWVSWIDVVTFSYFSAGHIHSIFVCRDFVCIHSVILAIICSSLSFDICRNFVNFRFILQVSLLWFSWIDVVTFSYFSTGHIHSIFVCRDFVFIHFAMFSISCTF